MSKATRQSLSYCHSEPSLEGEELLSKTLKGTTSDSDRDSSGFTSPRDAKLSYPQGKPTHNKHLQRKLFCHSEGFMPEESLLDLLTTLLVCHSEGGQSPTEESLKESLVAKRDSSVVTTPARHDNKSQTSPSSETRSHCDKIKSHEVPPLKASPLWGIYKGARILLWGWTSRTSEALAHTCTFKPLPLIEKEKRESTSDSLRDSSAFTKPQNDNESNPQDKITSQGKLVCHSEHCEETQPESLASPLFCHSELSQESEESLLSTKDSLNELLESPQRFFGAEAQRHDKLTAFTKNPKNNASLLSQARAKKLNNIREIPQLPQSKESHIKE